MCALLISLFIALGFLCIDGKVFGRIAKGVELSGGETFLGVFKYANDCAQAAETQGGYNFFIFSPVHGRCYLEHAVGVASNYVDHSAYNLYWLSGVCNPSVQSTDCGGWVPPLAVTTGKSHCKTIIVKYYKYYWTTCKVYSDPADEITQDWVQWELNYNHQPTATQFGFRKVTPPDSCTSCSGPEGVVQYQKTTVTTPSVGSKLTDITIKDEMRISFTMEVTGVPSSNVVQVLQIGTDSAQKRAPAVYIFETNRLWVAVSNNADWNNVFTYDGGINNGGTYTFVIVYTQSKWEVRINNQRVHIDNSFDKHTTGTSLPLYVCGTEYPAAPVKITNLEVREGGTGTFTISDVGSPVFDVPEYNGFEISDWLVYIILSVLLCVNCVLLYANCRRFKRKPKYKSVATVPSSEDDMQNLVGSQL